MTYCVLLIAIAITSASAQGPAAAAAADAPTPEGFQTCTMLLINGSTASLCLPAKKLDACDSGQYATLAATGAPVVLACPTGADAAVKPLVGAFFNCAIPTTSTSAPGGTAWCLLPSKPAACPDASYKQLQGPPAILSTCVNPT